MQDRDFHPEQDVPHSYLQQIVEQEGELYDLLSTWDRSNLIEIQDPVFNGLILYGGDVEREERINIANVSNTPRTWVKKRVRSSGGVRARPPIQYEDNLDQVLRELSEQAINGEVDEDLYLDLQRGKKFIGTLVSPVLKERGVRLFDKIKDRGSRWYEDFDLKEWGVLYTGQLLEK